MTDKVATYIGLANTQRQPLPEHSFAVGYLAQKLLSGLVKDAPLCQATYISGALHDLGKLDPHFQAWVSKKTHSVSEGDTFDGQHIEAGRFSFQKHARHNEISLLLYSLLDNPEYKTVNRQNKALIKHVLYWHHAKPIRKSEFTSLESIYKALGSEESTLNLLAEKTNELISAINVLANDYEPESMPSLSGLDSEIDPEDLYDLPNTGLPAYKLYHGSSDQIPDFVRSINENAKRNLARTAVITADRLVSAISRDQLLHHFRHTTLDQLLVHASPDSNHLASQIEFCLKGFDQRYPHSERNEAQAKAARQLSDQNGVAVLNGPAGCGKTKIALEWARNTGANKIIWVCPRVQICQGLLMDLTHSDYLPDTRIEICTGEFQYLIHQGHRTPTEKSKLFSGDIVLTTIDQIMNLIITHRNVTGLIEFLQACVVFDEFHEYIPMSGFNLLFAELVRSKQLCQPKANTLLVSATPNYRFVQALLGLDSKEIVGISSFNKGRYQIRFDEYDERRRDASNPLYASQPKNTIVISNTAITAQLSYIANISTEHSLLLHSKFKPSDKQALLESVYSAFGPTACSSRKVLRSGPIVQAALNISCQKMISEFTQVENWLQRLGRLNRFGEHGSVVQYVTAVPSSIANGSRKGACARFLAAMDSFNSAQAWYRFLQQQNLSADYCVNQLYDWYEAFYRSSEGKQAVDQDIFSSLKKGVEVLDRQLLDPVSLPAPTSDRGSRRLKRVSLRGNSRYVQMAVLKIDGTDVWEFQNNYATDADQENDLLTLSVDEMEGYDAMGDNNLLRYMHQKHHKIMTAKTGVKHKKAYKVFMLEREAVDPALPIYLSYIPQDLGLCHDQPHPNAIYYAVSDQQPVGAIAFNKLKSNNE